MTLYDETQDFKSIIGADSEDTVGNPTGVTEETSPKFSKAFLTASALPVESVFKTILI